MSPVKKQNLGIDIGGILVLALLGAVFYFQCIRPWTEQDQAVQAQRRQYLALRQRAANATSQARRLGQQLVAEQRTMPAPATGGEDIRRLNSRLSRIAALASRQGLQLRNVEPGRPASEGDRVLLPLHLTGIAGYRGCAEFLHAIRNEFSDMSVDSLHMTARPDGERTAVDFEMNLRWHAAAGIVSAQN